MTFPSGASSNHQAWREILCNDESRKSAYSKMFRQLPQESTELFIRNLHNKWRLREKSRSPKYGDDVAKGWKQNREFILGLIAATLSPLGSLLAAPQITAIIRQRQLSDDATKTAIPIGTDVLPLVLIAGILLMILGLIVIPTAIWKMRANKIESGVAAKFAQHVDECVRAVINFNNSVKNISGNSSVTEKARAQLLDKITTEATYIIGHKARVCIYWREAIEGKSQAVQYVLKRENVGERNPRSQARPVIEASRDTAHKSFIDVIEESGQRVVIQDVHASHQNNFTTNPNKANGYRSFLLIPIRSSTMSDGSRATVGCMTVDFPGKWVITEEIELVASALAEMFSEALEVAQGHVFQSNNEYLHVESPLEGLIREKIRSEHDKDS